MFRGDRRLQTDSKSAFTLIEIMTVIAIVAMMAGGVGMGIGALTNSKTRSDAMRIMSAVKFAQHRAIIHGKTTRIALSFEKNTMAIEEADGDIVLGNGNKDDLESEDGSFDPWKAAATRLEDGGHETQVGRSGFGPITGPDGVALKRYMPRELSSQIRKVITPHDSEAREEGDGYIYFFTNGFTEDAIVQLGDKAGEKIYSVVIEAATAKARIVPYAYEMDDLEDEKLQVRDSL